MYVKPQKHSFQKMTFEPMQLAACTKTPNCVLIILYQNWHLFSCTTFPIFKKSVTFLYEFPQKTSDETDFLQWNRVILVLVAVTFGLWPVDVLDDSLQWIKSKHVSSRQTLLRCCRTILIVKHCFYTD